MGTTTTTTLADTVKAVYDADYLVEVQNSAVFSQLVDWRWAVSGDPRTHGSTREIPTFGRTEPIATARTITEDATPVVMFDGYVTLTPYYYDFVMQKSILLDLQDYVSIGKPISREVARNGSESVDRLIRGVCIGGSYVWRYGQVARASLVYATTGHKASVANLSAIMAQVRSRGILGFSDNNSLVAPIHPLLAVDLLADSTFLAAEEYGPSQMKGIMNAEVGMYKLMNLRFLSSYTAKLYLSGGTALQAATTTTAALAAGATTVPVTEQTGLTAGAWISLGTLEGAGTLQTDGTTLDRHEMVLVTAQAGSSGAGNLTVQGIGTPDSGTNVGCRFAHTSGVAVTEACTVAAVPICGTESILGTYATMWGKTPKNFEHSVATHAPDILYDYGWQWYGGFTRHERALLVAEFAVSDGILGTN